MKHLAAYLLLQIGGNASPSASDIKSLLDTVGIEAEEERLDKLIAELEGKDVNEVSGARNSTTCFVPLAGEWGNEECLWNPQPLFLR
jgi:large subunit ribosomal protein LP2